MCNMWKKEMFFFTHSTITTTTNFNFSFWKRKKKARKSIGNERKKNIPERKRKIKYLSTDACEYIEKAQCGCKFSKWKKGFGTTMAICANCRNAGGLPGKYPFLPSVYDTFFMYKNTHRRLRILCFSLSFSLSFFSLLLTFLKVYITNTLDSIFISFIRLTNF